MALNQFTKEEAEVCKEAVDEMFNALPKSKRMEYLGHLNEICLFLERAKEKAPSESENKEEK